MKSTSKKKSKKKHSTRLSMLKSMKKNNINNNSFFEENENNLYEFLKSHNFQEFGNADDEMNDSKYMRNMSKLHRSRLTKLKTKQNMKSGIFQSQISNNLSMKSSLNGSNFYHNDKEKFDSESNFGESRVSYIKKATKSNFASEISKFKSRVYSNFNKNNTNLRSKINFQKANEGDIKMILNREAKNDRFFLDYKSPRIRIEGNISNPEDQDSSSSFENVDESKNKIQFLNNINKPNFYIETSDIENIKDINVLKNINEFNHKYQNTLNQKKTRKATTFDYGDSDNGLEAVNGRKKKKNINGKKKATDYFNNDFEDDAVVEKIKIRKDLKIVDINYNKYLNSVNNTAAPQNSQGKNILIHDSVFDTLQLDQAETIKIDHQDEDRLGSKNMKTVENDSDLLDQSLVRENNHLFIDHANIPKKLIYDKLSQIKKKFNKEERAKKIYEYKDHNTKLYNNVILLRPEIIQSQKQTQFHMFANNHDKKHNINYINYILKRANKIDEKKNLNMADVNEKIDRFSYKMEQLEKNRLNNFRRFDDLNNIQNTDLPETEYFDNNNNNKDGNGIITNKAGKGAVSHINGNKSNYFGDITKNNALSKINNNDDDEHKFMNQSKILADINKSTISNITRSEIKRLKNICSCFYRFYLNLKSFLISDPNKSFAEKKIIWTGKLGSFPEEFQDNRKVD